MSRTRLTVALVPPAGLVESIQVLRRAVDDPRVDRLVPHVTVVPPVNLDEADVVGAHQLVRRVAASTPPFTLRLGGAATFAPETPTLHLSVDGDLDSLSTLRDALMVTPFDRPDPRAFVPHVTLRRQLDPVLLPGAVETLSGGLGEWPVDRLTVLVHRSDEQGSRWVPVQDAPLGGPDIVGRGGIELRLRSASFHEPEVSRLLGEVPLGRWDHGIERCASVAELPDAPMQPVGVVTGRIDGATALLEGVFVEPRRRRAGIAAHLLAHWCSTVAARGCELAAAGPFAADGDVPALLRARGFVSVRDLVVRRL